MTRLFRRWSLRRRPAAAAEWPALPPACDPWAEGEAFDPMTDTQLLPVVGGVR